MQTIAAGICAFWRHLAHLTKHHQDHVVAAIAAGNSVTARREPLQVGTRLVEQLPSARSRRYASRTPHARCKPARRRAARSCGRRGARPQSRFRPEPRWRQGRRVTYRQESPACNLAVDEVRRGADAVNVGGAGCQRRECSDAGRIRRLHVLNIARRAAIRIAAAKPATLLLRGADAGSFVVRAASTSAMDRRVHNDETRK